MKPKAIILIKTCALILAAIVTVLTMWRASGQTIDIGILGFMMWGISPYMCFFIATYLLEGFTAIPRVPAIGFVIALLMLGFTLLTYLGTLNDTSSTSALIFVFVPFWLFVGGFLLLGISVLVAWLANRRR